MKKETQVIRKLQRSLPVPTIVKTKRGALIFTLGSLKGYMTNFIPGKSFKNGYDVPKRNLVEMGSYLKKIHNTKIKVKKNDLRKHLSQFYRNLPSSPVKSLSLEILQYLSQEKFFSTKFKQNFCHNDLHSLNIIINKEKIVGILDFEECFYGPAIIDLATTILDTCWKSNSFSSSRMHSILRGYGRLAKAEQKYLMHAILFAELYELHWYILAKGTNNIYKSQQNQVKYRFNALHKIQETVIFHYGKV